MSHSPKTRDALMQYEDIGVTFAEDEVRAARAARDRNADDADRAANVLLAAERGTEAWLAALKTLADVAHATATCDDTLRAKQEQLDLVTYVLNLVTEA